MLGVENDWKDNRCWRKKVAFKAQATIPRLYRIKFKRDIFKNLAKLEKSFINKKDGFKIADFEIFENVAYIMTYHADNTIPNDIIDWLEQFEMLPEILTLWGVNLDTQI